MEKQEKRSTYTLQNENFGSVKIADDVVAAIAGIAATEVKGVAGMVGNVMANEIKNKVGMKNPTKGVKVEVNDGEVRVTLSILMEYGYNIPATSRKVQEKVKNSIENMTGLTVTDVNIRIGGVDMEKGN